MNSFWKYNIASILWALFILALCLLPGKDLPTIPILNFDKLVHFSIYAILALMMFYGWKKQDLFPALHRNTIARILILTSLYGFAVEVMQEIFTSDRHFDLFDALANSSGAITGSLLGALVKKENITLKL